MATATRTVVFTDLANYTASVSGRDREGLRALIHKHERFVRPICQRHNGNVVKNLGDAFLILFASATDALRAGMEIIETSTRAEDGLSFRVSAATGDIEEMSGDAFGEPVNLSARINSKTPAGQIWIAESTRLCMNQSEIPFEAIGRYKLKGIAGEVGIHRVVPPNTCELPDAIIKAVRADALYRIRRGDPPPRLSGKPVLLFEGFTPSSPALQRVMDGLPVLAPAQLWLSAYNIAPIQREAWEGAGRGLVIGTPKALDAAISAVRAVQNRPMNANTIILDISSSAELELVMAGLALPSVPMAGVVSGYTYDLLPDGRWVSRSPRAVLRVDVSPEDIRIIPLSPAVTIQGRSTRISGSYSLSDGDLLATPSGTVEFRRLTDCPYAGMLLADTPLRLPVSLGQTVELGREPRHPGMALPDRSGQENIRWCTGQRAARAREGGFTLDRALAGRHQAAITAGPDSRTTVRALHERLATWISRPSQPLRRVDGTVEADIGDLVITGTAVVSIRQPELGG